MKDFIKCILWFPVVVLCGVLRGLYNIYKWEKEDFKRIWKNNPIEIFALIAFFIVIGVAIWVVFFKGVRV